MLSPHEFATLMLVKHIERTTDFDQADLRTLVDRKLVEPDSTASTHSRLRLTDLGHALLHMFR
ncbi:hypothetical protein [Paraburkholderia sp. 2C]